MGLTINRVPTGDKSFFEYWLLLSPIELRDWARTEHTVNDVLKCDTLNGDLNEGEVKIIEVLDLTFDWIQSVFYFSCPFWRVKAAWPTLMKSVFTWLWGRGCKRFDNQLIGSRLVKSLVGFSHVFKFSCHVLGHFFVRCGLQTWHRLLDHTLADHLAQNEAEACVSANETFEEDCLPSFKGEPDCITEYQQCHLLWDRFEIRVGKLNFWSFTNESVLVEGRIEEAVLVSDIEHPLKQDCGRCECTREVIEHFFLWVEFRKLLFKELRVGRFQGCGGFWLCIKFIFWHFGSDKDVFILAVING